MTSPAANADQIEYWNEISGPRWVAAQERLDLMIEGLGLAALERARVIPGERVIDVGCGCGATSLALAARVGSAGHVLGLDISGPMLARARERAEQRPELKLDLEQADAQTHVLGEPVDLVFSRFGVMFFEDPVAAFRNLRQGLVPGGRLCFVCWQPLEVNPWMALPMQAVASHVPPRPRPEPGSPGPYAFADPEHVRGILDQAGFGEIEIESQAYTVGMGATVEEALSFLVEGVGPVASSLAEASADARELASDALRVLLSGHQSERGVEFDSAVWIVTARNPGDAG